MSVRVGLAGLAWRIAVVICLCLALLGGGLAAAFADEAPPATDVAPPPENPPPENPAPEKEHGLFSIWDPRTSPFIPIPEIGTDPNGGTTLGLLTVFLTSEHDQITRILAPDVIYNPQLGFGGNFRLLAYPSEDAQWSVTAGVKQRIERGVDGTYQTGILRQGSWSLFHHLVYDRSATGRFFGFGNDSQKADQSSYTEEQAFYEGRIGYNFGPTLQVTFNLRPRYVQIEHGSFSSLPSTNEVFPNLPGLGNERDFLNRVFIAYDTRDSGTIPTQGSAIVAFAGISNQGFLSSVSYSGFGLDVKHFEPINDRLGFAGHVALQYMPVGNDAPFWALSSLGGDRSVLAERQPLRGFGADRFIDRNLFSSSVELRQKVLDLNLFSTELAVELAPFIEAGRVFHKLGDSPIGRLHLDGGLGFRAIAKPFIVGYVDIGYGGEGIAIFSGINYPF